MRELSAYLSTEGFDNGRFVTAQPEQITFDEQTVSGTVRIAVEQRNGDSITVLYDVIMDLSFTFPPCGMNHSTCPSLPEPPQPSPSSPELSTVDTESDNNSPVAQSPVHHQHHQKTGPSTTTIVLSVLLSVGGLLLVIGFIAAVIFAAVLWKRSRKVSGEIYGPVSIEDEEII